MTPPDQYRTETTRIAQPGGEKSIKGSPQASRTPYTCVRLFCNMADVSSTMFQHDLASVFTMCWVLHDLLLRLVAVRLG